MGSISTALVSRHLDQAVRVGDGVEDSVKDGIGGGGGGRGEVVEEEES
jgi:hypothetical protein